MQALGPGWQHGWDQKLSTYLFQHLTVGELAVRGYREVPADSARRGDIVVRYDHAGVYGGDWGPSTPGVWGWANNGRPATPTKPNETYPDGWYNFKTITVKDADTGELHTYQPHFYRALVLCTVP